MNRPAHAPRHRRDTDTQTPRVVRLRPGYALLGATAVLGLLTSTTAAAMPAQSNVAPAMAGFVRHDRYWGSKHNTHSPSATVTTSPTSSLPAPSTTTSTTSTTSSSTTSTTTAAPTTTTASPTATATAPSAFPNAATTGVPAGTTLTSVPGQLKSGPGWHWDGRAVVIDADSVTLNGLDINGPVVSNYSRLTVKNTRIRCTGENDWCVPLWDHAVLTDSEIGGGADGKTFMHAIGVWTGGSASANLIQRVNIHHTIHGLRVDGGTTMVDSYVHDLPMGDPVRNVNTGQLNTDDHTDGLMSTGGGNVVVRHNRIEGGNTANLFVQWDGSSERIGPYLVEGNLFVNIHRNGQDSSWGVCIENKGISGAITVRDNTFTKSTWTVGPISAPPGSSVTANVYEDGSSAQ